MKFGAMWWHEEAGKELGWRNFEINLKTTNKYNISCLFYFKFETFISPSRKDSFQVSKSLKTIYIDSSRI